ncbi:hypothetical protein D3C75_1275520 [compost metagenome]
MEDYLLSNVTLVNYHQKTYDIIAKYVSAEDLEALKEAMELKECYLDASMRSILDTYETFDRYLKSEFGIDDAIRKSIQNYCLE